VLCNFTADRLIQTRDGREDANKTEEMSMDKTCRSLIGFEERAAGMYRNLARRFAKNRELSWFWFEMSIEEQRHAVLLEFCGCEDLLGKNMPDRGTLREITNLLDRIQEKANSKKISIDDAFLIAAELETSEVVNIYAHLVGPVRGTSYILRKKIEALGSDHLQALIRGAKRFRVRAATMSRLLAMKRQELRTAS
jgi:rubrerythrin